MKNIRNLFIPATLALAFTLTACSKNDDTVHIAVIDGVQKPVLSAKVTTRYLAANNYVIYLYLSEDRKEYLGMLTSDEHHGGKYTDLTRKEAEHGGVLGHLVP